VLRPINHAMTATPLSARRQLFDHRRVQWFGLVAGPALALVLYGFLPDQYTNTSGEVIAFSAAGRATFAMMVWMGVWWLTEAVDVSVTALLPIGMFPILGIADIGAATAPYARDLIFLFMGGFLLALSMQRWGLDKRIALITLRIVGSRPNNMIAGFMIATGVLSAFVSNTATTAMMLPIGMSVIALVNQSESGAGGRRFATCLMLGIAYAASIGGISTIIGTPPNAILAGFLAKDIAPEYRTDISFAQWMKVGVPLVVVFLPLTWLLLTRLIYPPRIKSIPGGREFIHNELRKHGPLKIGEWITFIIFCITAFCWIFRTTLLAQPLPGLSDAGIAIIASLLLFVIPVNLRTRTFTLDWTTAVKLPWGILILFGGGLSLASAVDQNGVAQFIGAQSGALGGLPTIVLVVCVITVVVFLTELTSNTATTTSLLPVLAGVAIGLDIHPYLLCIPAAVGASCAFMLPVATPPNAIVFGSGSVTIGQMCKAGLWLNVLGIILITGLTYAIIIPLLIASK